ncbi:MAG: bifunctional phosphoribosylaminoimidazolecarboxamide formyltransferase/IMP cyclohydrolase PurH, partial [Saprospiraceae bacterium]|nr:bifunctional phosphoribosylaminoimidazolecarboxamide formyltransferase/IMP cyclohydrolase PurH [Saprospiraceae bacterium]
MSTKHIHSALISVYHKTGLAPIIEQLQQLNIKIYSTGGTQSYIESLGAAVESVEKLTSYPSILDGRVKTLHPKIFGGILARREQKHLAELIKYNIPEIDLVIVDLYPFEQTVVSSNEEAEIIEKIDIGGISLIRAAAKNYKEVVVVAAQAYYADLLALLQEKQGDTTLEDRQRLARKAFAVTSHYDAAIYQYFAQDEAEELKLSIRESQTLRYGENPHQAGIFYGDLSAMFDKLGGKELSYNNLVDVDAAVGLMREFQMEAPTFAILKHTNACGVATRTTL